jgi:hypothetical protein
LQFSGFQRRSLLRIDVRGGLHKIECAMVEKAIDNADETVLVEARPDLASNRAFGEQTLGAAIEAFEEIASGLFSLQVFAPAKAEEEKSVKKSSVAGKTLRLPLMIELGITAAIDQNKATQQSIGSLSDKSALVEGNIVALYSPGAGSFVRIMDYGNSVSVDFFDPQDIDKLPFEWNSERFLVVDAGNGCIAFYSPSHRRFLAAHEGRAEANGYPIGKLNETPRCNETFRVEDPNDGSSSINLYCCIDDNRAMHVVYQDDNSCTSFKVVQINGFEPAE